MMAVQGWVGVNLNLEYEKHMTRMIKILERQHSQHSQRGWIFKYQIQASKSDLKRQRELLDASKKFFIIIKEFSTDEFPDKTMHRLSELCVCIYRYIHFSREKVDILIEKQIPYLQTIYFRHQCSQSTRTHLYKRQLIIVKVNKRVPGP